MAVKKLSGGEISYNADDYSEYVQLVEYLTIKKGLKIKGKTFANPNIFQEKFYCGTKYLGSVTFTHPSICPEENMIVQAGTDKNLNRLEKLIDRFIEISENPKIFPR